MNPEQTHHKLKNNYTKEILTLLRKSCNPQQISQPEDLAKGLRTPRELDFGGYWGLTTELPQDWGNRQLGGAQKNPCVYWDPGERSSDPKSN